MKNHLPTTAPENYSKFSVPFEFRFCIQIPLWIRQGRNARLMEVKKSPPKEYVSKCTVGHAKHVIYAVS